MYRHLSLVLLIGSAVAEAGCSGSAGNSAANVPNKNVGVNANIPANVSANNLPPGISTTPLSPPANAVNTAPANSISPKTATTPGIPGPAELKKQAKPGTTPTPGIPSAEEMRKAFSKPVANANTPPPPTANSVPMMRTNRKFGGKP